MSTYTNIVERATALIPQTTDLGLFTVVGNVEMIRIVGEVETIIGAVANDTLLKMNPTVGADVDLCAALEINGDAAGTLYNITGTVANAMVATTSGAVIDQVLPMILPDGVLELECAGNSLTGKIKWTLHYVPLDANSYVTAVAIP